MAKDYSIHIDNVLPLEWDAFVAASASGHLLQTWAWGEFKARFGWRPVRLAISGGGELAGLAQVLLRRTPLGPMAYVPKGPVLDETQPGLAEPLMEGLRQVAAKHHVISVKMEPDWADSAETRAWLAQAGLQPSAQTVQPPRTIVVDLTPSEEQILEAMKSKTRYNIHLAERKGVSIQEGDESHIPEFHRLMQVTGARDEFGVHSQEYFRQAWRLFAPADRGRLLLATYDGQILAALMVFALGRKAWYMYGASSNEHRNLMPTYLLQWEAMRWARSKGCQAYDLFGIPDLDEDALEAGVKDEAIFGNAKPPLWGVYRHKRGYGGKQVRYVGAYDRVYRPAAHRLLTMALKMWKRLRG